MKVVPAQSVWLAFIYVAIFNVGRSYRSSLSLIHQSKLFRSKRNAGIMRFLAVDPSVVNFADEFVDCVSEGKAANITLRRTTAVRPPSRSEGIDRNVNFEDQFVDCVSNSGAALSPSTSEWIGSEEDGEVLISRKNEFVAFFQQTSAQILDELFTFSRKYLTLPAIEDNLIVLSEEIDRLERERQDQWTSKQSSLRPALLLPGLLKWKRYQLLTSFLQQDAGNYQQIVKRLLLPRVPVIPRSEYPNVQNIPLPVTSASAASGSYELSTEEGTLLPLVENSPLSKIQYSENILEKALLSLFRKYVQEEIQYKSDQPGILGLLEEGRSVKLSTRGNENNSEFQHAFVKKVLGRLLTPVLPPFYRIFMSGIIPSSERNDPDWLVKVTAWLHNKLPESLQEEYPLGKQIGPLFYAPFLTSIVTPPFMSFLLGPCQPNRRIDGALGGMVVTKCKFLQESNCKGLCLHQCKIPAEEYFKQELGMDLSVKPNFITQECQWSWGEKPLRHELDSDFPKGCISGCQTRKIEFPSKESESFSVNC